MKNFAGGCYLLRLKADLQPRSIITNYHIAVSHKDWELLNSEIFPSRSCDEKVDRIDHFLLKKPDEKKN